MIRDGWEVRNDKGYNTRNTRNLHKDHELVDLLD